MFELSEELLIYNPHPVWHRSNGDEDANVEAIIPPVLRRIRSDSSGSGEFSVPKEVKAFNGGYPS